MILEDKIVGISEIYVGKEGENIITVGLGSCVGAIDIWPCTYNAK